MLERICTESIIITIISRTLIYYFNHNLIIVYFFVYFIFVNMLYLSHTALLLYTVKTYQNISLIWSLEKFCKNYLKNLKN